MEAFGEEAKKYSDVKYADDKYDGNVETVWVDILLTTAQHIMGEMTKKEWAVLESNAIVNRHLYLTFTFVDRVIHVTMPSIMAIAAKDVALLKREQDAEVKEKISNHLLVSEKLQGTIRRPRPYYGSLL